MKLAHHLNQIGGCATAKPIIIDLLIRKRIEQAKWIVNIRRRPCKMVTIIFALQLLDRLLSCAIQDSCQMINMISHLRQQLLLCDTTNRGIGFQHTDVIDVVQLTKNAQLRELRDSSQEDKA